MTRGVPFMAARSFGRYWQVDKRRAAVIAELDAGDTEATLWTMAAQIVEYRRVMALLAGAIELARVGAPFAATGPLGKPTWNIGFNRRNSDIRVNF